MTRAKRLVELLGESESHLAGCDGKNIVQLAGMIERIERNISRLLQYYANRCQLTLLEAQALAAILELDNKARISAVAEYARMPLSTMTGVAARLEKAGLVERKRASDDGRASVLSLTAEGVTTMRELFQPFFREVAQVIEKAGPETLQSVIDSFTIVSELAEQLGSRADDRMPD